MLFCATLTAVLLSGFNEKCLEIEKYVEVEKR